MQPVLERPNLPAAPPDERGFTNWARAVTNVLFTVLSSYGRRINGSITTDGETAMAAPLPLAPYTIATLPTAADWEGAIIYVSDGAAGQRFRGSDGATWVNLG